MRKRKSKEKVRRKIMAGRRITRWDEKENKSDKEGKSLPWKEEE